MAIELLSLTCDRPVESPAHVLGEMELALDAVRELRQRLCDNGEPCMNDAIVTLGLYVQHTDRLIAKGRELVNANALS